MTNGFTYFCNLCKQNHSEAHPNWTKHLIIYEHSILGDDFFLLNTLRR